MNIDDATPTELLHAVVSGLYENITEGMELTFTPSPMDLISQVDFGIYQDSRRQSEYDLPALDSFHHELMSIKLLKTKERLSRVHSLFLALTHSYLINELRKK